VADEPRGDAYTATQLDRLRAVAAGLGATGVRPDLLHACNSAGAMAHPAARLDLVRCGIALYGHAPGPALAAASEGLRPALSLKARVAHVQKLEAGEGVSYGLRYVTTQQTVVATLPLGYADGVPRRLGEVGGEVLVGGARRPLAGTVTMDQVMVDCGPGSAVAVGDEVVLIGSQGEQQVTAWEWAERLGTIAYEVLCGVGARVPRYYRDESG